MIRRIFLFRRFALFRNKSFLEGIQKPKNKENDHSRTYGEYLRFTNTTTRQKYRNVTAEPRIAMSVNDPDRPYRRRRPANEVFEDLQRNSGKQFAPELVNAFFRGILKELTGEMKDKRFRRLLGREYMESENLVPTLKRALNGMSPTSALTMVSLD